MNGRSSDLGRYIRTLEPGLALIIPIVDRVGARLNMMETVLEVPQQSVITRDNAVVTVDAIVFYQVLDAAKRSLRGGQSAARDIEPCNHQHSHRDGVDDPRRAPLRARSHQHSAARRRRCRYHRLGVKVQRVEIKDIAPPPELVAAMARQMKAERERRANVLEADGFKQAAVLKAEGEKAAVILAAEGRREAAFREAEARERQAEAEAKATTSRLRGDRPRQYPGDQLLRRATLHRCDQASSPGPRTRRSS